jgi:ribosome biogenesis SPOUT family RNA methylase Rps3
MPDPKHITIVATFVSAGVAQGAGGFVIVGGKLKKIPPRGLKQLQAAAQLIDASAHLGNKTLARNVQDAAIKLAQGVAAG